MNEIIKMTLSKEVVDFIDATGSLVIIDGVRYIQPANNWYKATKEEGVYEVTGRLPEKFNSSIEFSKK